MRTTFFAVVLLAVMGAVLTLIYPLVYSHTASRHSWQSQQQQQRLRELMGWWKAPGLDKPAGFKGASTNRMDFKHYYVATSTIPGAGLGVFARHDMPTGFIWNVEDVLSGSTFNITRTQWDAIRSLAGTLEAMGIQHHAMYDLVSFIRRHTYYCAEADLLLFPLTGTTFTNHAFLQPVPAVAGSQPQGPKPTKARRHLAAAAAATGRGQTHQLKKKGIVLNSGFAWPPNAEQAAAQAKSLGAAPPGVFERCVLFHTLRAVEAGDELMEDYESYECPWPGYRSPIADVVRQQPALLSED
eukprot:gene6363-6596_t